MSQEAYRRMFNSFRVDLDCERFEERAAIQHFDAGLPLHDAEFEAALVQWVEQGRNPVDLPYLGA